LIVASAQLQLRGLQRIAHAASPPHPSKT